MGQKHSEKIPEKFQEKTLNSLHTRNYSYSICIIFTTTYIALTWYYGFILIRNDSKYMEDHMYIIFKYYTILYEGLKHLHLLVMRVFLEPVPLIVRENCIYPSVRRVLGGRVCLNEHQMKVYGKRRREII